MELLRDKYNFTAMKLVEDDGSVTMSLNEIDLMDNAPTEQEAILALAQDTGSMPGLLSGIYLWSVAPNRKDHVPLL